MEQFSTNKWKYIKKYDDFVNQPLSTDIRGGNVFNIGDAVEVALNSKKNPGEKGIIVPKLNKDADSLGVKLVGSKKTVYIDKSFLTKISLNDIRDAKFDKE